MNVKSLFKYSAAFILGIGGILYIFFVLNQVQKDLNYKEFEKNAIRDAMLVQDQFNLALELTNSIRSFFNASEFVSHHEFKVFAEPLLQEYPFVQAVEWIPLVTEENHQEFLNKARNIYSDFKIYQKQDNKTIEVKDRDFYYPVYYVHPQKGNKKAIGFDLGSEKNRLLALEKARDTGKATITGKIYLVQSKSISTPEEGVLIFKPIYTQKTSDIHSRRENLQGFALSVVNVSNLLNGISSLTNFKNIVLHEVLPEESLRDPLDFTYKINIADKSWHIHIPIPEEVITKYNWLPISGAIMSIFIYLMVCFAFYLYINRNATSEKIIRNKTRELLHTNHLLNSIQFVQQQFISGEPPERYFDHILQDFLEFTESEFGFIGEICYENGKPYLHTYAITNIAWNYETRKFYEENAPQGLKFYNLENLFGAVIKTGQYVISNDPQTDPRSSGIPEGHPKLKSFLGVPFIVNKNLVGIAGVANREAGYSEQLLSEIQPLITNTAYIINEYRIKREHQRIEQENYYYARNDVLTGIPNRMLFEEQLNKVVSLIDRTNSKLALMYIDLDDFKPVNDNHGHDIGDLLLREISIIMSCNIRASDILARIGGDEFAVIIPAIKDKQEPIIMAEKILDAVRRPIVISDTALNIGLSIGIAYYPDDATSIMDLIKQADNAMYLAKNEGKNKYRTINFDNGNQTEAS